MGSRSDEKLGHEIGKQCSYLGVAFRLRISSAHKSTEDVLKIISEYDGKYYKYLYMYRLFDLRWKRAKRAHYCFTESITLTVGISPKERRQHIRNSK